MLIPIKIFTIKTNIPVLSDLEEAKQICLNESCAVELRWLPNIMTGWYHLYIAAEDDVYEMYETQIPKIYGV